MPPNSHLLGSAQRDPWDRERHQLLKRARSQGLAALADVDENRVRKPLLQRSFALVGEIGTTKPGDVFQTQGPRNPRTDVVNHEVSRQLLEARCRDLIDDPAIKQCSEGWCKIVCIEGSCAMIRSQRAWLDI